MTVTPTDILSTPLSVLKTMLSECQAFQTWTGTANAAAALARIYLVGVSQADLDAQATSAHALIRPGPWRRGMNGGGLNNQFAPSGSNTIVFEALISSGNQGNSADAYFEFANDIGKILDDFEALSGGDGYLFITDIDSPDNAERVSQDEEVVNGDRYSIDFDVSWGLE